MNRLSKLVISTLIFSLSSTLFAATPLTLQPTKGLLSQPGFIALGKLQMMQLVDNNQLAVDNSLSNLGFSTKTSRLLSSLRGSEIPNLIETSHFNVGIILRPSLFGYSQRYNRYLPATDNDYLVNLSNHPLTILPALGLGNTLDGGLAAAWQEGSLKLTASATTQLHNKYSGQQELAASLGNSFTFNSFTVTPSIGLKWQSDKLLGYYYGALPQDTSLFHPIYKGKPSLSYTAGLNAAYTLDKYSGLFAHFEYERTDSPELTYNPLLEDNQMRLFLGYGWRFK